MSEPKESTPESRFLEKHPAIRKAVTENPQFQEWKKGLRALDIDGEHLYFNWGDTPRDENQVIHDWAFQKGLITQADLDKGT